MSDEIKRRVDESWKDAVNKEKSAESPESGEPPIEASFGLFITGIMMEAVIALGDMENPVTQKKEQNLQRAKFLIDTLEMLKEKTKNNLSKDEDDAVNSVLYELRMRFVAKIKEPGTIKP